MKECRNCRYYQKYYTKESYFFQKQQDGLCSRSSQTKSRGESCENWAGRSPTHTRSLRWALSARTLNQMASDLSQIRQIIKEDAEDEQAEKTKTKAWKE